MPITFSFSHFPYFNIFIHLLVIHWNSPCYSRGVFTVKKEATVLCQDHGIKSNGEGKKRLKVVYQLRNAHV